MLVPEECNKCKSLFDLSFDISFDDDEDVSDSIKAKFAKEYLCWACREIRANRCVAQIY